MRFKRTTALTGVFALSASLLTFTAVNTNSMSPAAAADLSGPWSAVVDPAVGAPLNQKVYSLLQSGSTVYLGGMFTGAGDASAPASYVATFDASNTSTNWQRVTTTVLPAGSGYTYVASMALSGTDLYLGGRFGAGTLNNIAKVPLSTGIPAGMGTGTQNSSASDAERDVEEIAVIGSNVYAGGGFGSIGGVTNTGGIGVWNGTAWAALDSGLAGDGSNLERVNGMLAVGSTLYIGGQFLGGLDGATTISSKKVISWDDSSSAWSAMGDGFGSGLVATFANSTSGAVQGLFAGGNFPSTAAGTPVTVNGLAKWNSPTTGAWNPVGSTPGVSGGQAVIEAMAFDSSGNLYVGGNFTSVGGVSANNIARWDGTTWSALTCGPINGLNGTVRGILPQSDGTLLVGGFFTDAGSDRQADYVARYNPSAAANCPFPSTGGGSSAGTPSAPQNVKARWNPSDGEGSITVTWDAPATDNGSPIVQYVASTADGRAECYTGVAYTCKISVKDVRIPFRKPVSSGNAAQSENFWANINNVELARQYLFTNVLYTDQVTVAWANGIYVQARNGVGWGAQGFVPQRDPNAPVERPSAPLNPKAVAGLKEITVSWEPSSDSSPFPVTNYLVQSTPAGSVCITRMTDANLLECKFTNLTPGVDYTFKVQGLNGGGWGDFSAPSNSASPLNLLADTIERVQNRFLFIKTGSTLTVDGRAPGFEPGTVITPQLKIGENGSWVSETRDLPKVPAKGLNKRFTWTKKLNKSVNKQPVEVRFIIGGITSNSMKANIGTSLGFPSAPRDVKVSSSTAGIKVEWKAPAKNGGSPITSYEVTSNLGKWSCTVKAPATSCTQQPRRPDAHDPNKTYTFEVVAKTARGTGREASAQWRGAVYRLNLFSRVIVDNEMVLNFSAEGFTCSQQFEVEAKIESNGRWTKQPGAATTGSPDCKTGQWIGPVPKVDRTSNVYYRIKSPKGYSNERRLIVRN